MGDRLDIRVLLDFLGPTQALGESRVVYPRLYKSLQLYRDVKSLPLNLVSPFDKVSPSTHRTTEKKVIS
jgi:hypothetical protein